MNRSQPINALWIIMFIAVSSMFSACGGAKLPVEQQLPVLISSIEPRDADGATEILVEGSGPIEQYTSFQLTEPMRLVVDITDANVEKFQEAIMVNKGPVLEVTPSQQDTIARLEIGLTQPVDSKLYLEGGKLMIEIGKPAQAAIQAKESDQKAVQIPPATKEEQPPLEEKPVMRPEIRAASVVTSIKTAARRDGTKVIITGNGAMRPNTFMVEGKRLVIDIPGARSKVRPAVIPVRKGGLDKVRVGQHPVPDEKVRVVLDLTRPMEYTATSEGNQVIIAMTAVSAAAAHEKEPAEKAAPVEKTGVSEKEIIEKPAAAVVEKKTVPIPATTKDDATIFQRDATSVSDINTVVGSKYSGRKISLDLQDADLVNVLRLFAEVANLNIILAPDVKGKVTVRMLNVPWDQAMDIILKMNGLGYATEDNILRIASLGLLAREAEEESKAKEAKKKAEDLITRVVTINYATAKAIDGTLRKSLSPRGETVVDDRTNTIIVKDIARHVDDIVTLVKLLDKPIPQVMIEARIVEATTTFAREIGVQWGGAFNADAAHGNATGLVFPNSVTVTGGGLSGIGTSGNYFVNMPAGVTPGLGGAVGLTFGSLNKALNLDLILSALESTGEGRVLSQPRINALDNKEAKITQGFTMPYLNTTATSGATVQFIDAMLSLNVTPHVTPDNKVFLKIKATKNAPDSSVQVQGLPSIRKNEAETEVLLADGETTVIGGVLVRETTHALSSVPFFGDLPLIGWLFKKKSTIDNKRELLIFITPRVVKQEVI